MKPLTLLCLSLLLLTSGVALAQDKVPSDAVRALDELVKKQQESQGELKNHPAPKMNSAHFEMPWPAEEQRVKLMIDEPYRGDQTRIELVHADPWKK